MAEARGLLQLPLLQLVMKALIRSQGHDIALHNSGIAAADVVVLEGVFLEAFIVFGMKQPSHRVSGCTEYSSCMLKSLIIVCKLDCGGLAFGVASFIGLGSGLHTSVLYLGHHIPPFTIMRCNVA
ncbi:hypothetical protein Vadar_002880 [Vaccinium darrowii]|uniref:Uncharacterized protein n=1 Tax=Vaccinium darrowii TaxID=229202 RepID=A0ACB7YJ12_9ERIC|nr:hypothetical protein Vadar_002880 [Vaccinium darrowii]